MYTVWTLTVLVGFPMSPLRTVDKRIALAYISIYYLVMSIVCLNLFVALLSHVFSRVYKDATKYALLERAKAILNTDGFVGPKRKAAVRDYVQNKCNPLVSSTLTTYWMTKNEFMSWTAESKCYEYNKSSACSWHANYLLGCCLVGLGYSYCPTTRFLNYSLIF